MSQYVEKCPCCNNHSLEVTQHDWGKERRCELCGFAVAPSLPTQAHVGNAVAFVSAACSWFDEKNLDMPLDEHLAETIRSGAEALEFVGERKVSPEEAERLPEEFQAEVIDKFYVREDDDAQDEAEVSETGSQVTLRVPEAALEKLRETLELDSKSSAFDPELRKEIRDALDQVKPVADSADDALRRVYDLLYLDVGPTGDFYNPDKASGAETLDAIAEVVRERFGSPGPCLYEASVRTVRDVDSSEFFKGESREWEFCREHATMKHVEACEFLVHCDAATVEKAVDFGCREEFVNTLRRAAAESRDDADKAWLWLYAG